MDVLNVPGEKAQAYLDRDHAVVSPSYPRAYPFMMDHGKGSEVWDVDGNRYIDFASGIAVCSTGHSHPDVVAAIKDQVDRFIHISSDFYHPVWVEFSERLAQTAPFEEPASELRDAVIEGTFKRGLIGLGSGKSSIRFAPPLNITRELIDEGLLMLEDALAEAESSA